MDRDNVIILYSGHLTSTKHQIHRDDGKQSFFGSLTTACTDIFLLMYCKGVETLYAVHRNMIITDTMLSLRCVSNGYMYIKYIVSIPKPLL
jgi:hypothetical protein